MESKYPISFLLQICTQCAPRPLGVPGFFRYGRMTPEDGLLQIPSAGVGDLPLGTLRNLIGLPEPDAPVQEQPQLHPHGMHAGFHYDEAAFRHGFELVRRHEGPLHHLEGLAGIVFPPADGAAHDGSAAQRTGELLSRLTPRRKAAEQIHLS